MSTDSSNIDPASDDTNSDDEEPATEAAPRSRKRTATWLAIGTACLVGALSLVFAWYTAVIDDTGDKVRAATDAITDAVRSQHASAAAYQVHAGVCADIDIASVDDIVKAGTDTMSEDVAAIHTLECTLAASDKQSGSVRIRITEHDNSTDAISDFRHRTDDSVKRSAPETDFERASYTRGDTGGFQLVAQDKNLLLSIALTTTGSHSRSHDSNSVEDVLVDLADAVVKAVTTN